MKNKKKKYTNKKHQTILKSVKYHSINNKMNLKTEPIYMLPSLMFNRGEHNKKTIVTGGFSEFRKYNSDCDLFKNYMYSTLEEDIAPLINKASEEYISKCSEKKRLDLFRNDSIMYNKADVFDFTKCDEDILKNVMNNISTNKVDVNDLNYLWTTNEYIHIIYSPSLEFAIQRIGFNEDNQTICYKMVGYENRILHMNKKITIPSFIIKFEVAMKHAKDINIPNDNNSEKNLTSLLWNSIKQFDNIIKDDSGDCIYPVFTITDWILPTEYITFLKKYLKSIILSKEVPSKVEEFAALVITGAAKSIISDLYIENKNQHNKNDLNNISMPYLHQKISIAIACIIITNLMLKSKKMSAPIKSRKTSHIQYTVNPSVNNDTPIRKTRNLGNIKIISHKRPSLTSTEKIIRFNKSEWSRQGFFRHYKNGKIIYIKPTTVKRRCIDISLPQVEAKSTKYVIHGMNENVIPQKKIV